MTNLQTFIKEREKLIDKKFGGVPMFNSLSTTQGEVFYASDIKSFHRQSLQDLLALIAEEVKEMKESRGWNGHSTIDTVSVVEANEEVDDIFKSILSLLRSSLQ